MSAVTSTIAGFDVLRVEELPLLQATAYELRHEATGAGLIHFAAADEENRLSSVVPTWALDDTGWPHVLEHCVLYSRSRHYSRADAMRGRRWLATGGGAWTGPDFTHYGLAAPDPGAFCELIDLRCDQLFEPELDDEVFWNQIGTGFDASGALEHHGIIYNEQKSIAGLALLVAWDDLMGGLFPGSQYDIHSGGRFLEMPGLTPERLRQEHARHYQPSRARFASWGPAPLADVAAAFDAALSRVPHPSAKLALPPAARDIAAPVRRLLALPAAPGGDAEAGRQVLLAWATVDWSDPYQLLLQELACETLLRDSDSPLRHAFAKAGFAGGAAETIYEHGWRPRRHIFATGVKGAGDTQAERVQQVVLDTLAEVRDRGVDAGAVDRALTRVERRLRLAGPDAGSSMLMLTSVLPPWLLGGDPLASLRFEELARRFREDRGALGRFVDEQLLKNPRRALLAVEPDPGGIEALVGIERERLQRQSAELDEAGREAILEQGRRVAARQQANEAELKAVEPPSLEGLDSTVPEPALLAHDGVEARLAATRGVTYVDAYADLGGLPDQLVPLLGVYRRLLQQGGLEAEVTALVDATGGRWSPRLRLSVAALPSERDEAVARILAALTHPSFGAESIAQARADAAAAAEEGQFIHAAQNVIRLAAAQVRGAYHFLDSVYGFDQLDLLRGGEEVGARQLAEIAAHLREAPLEISLAVSAEADVEAVNLRGRGEPTWRDEQPAAGGSEYRTWSQTGTFNAQVHRLPGVAAAEAPALLVALQYASLDHVRPEVATRGTAYSAMAMADLDSGYAMLVSVRDPHVERTFAAFDEALRRVREEPLDPATLHRARIDAWKQTEIGLDAASRARRAVEDARRGVGAADRTRLRAKVLAVTPEEVSQAAAGLGEPGRATLGPAR